MLVGAARVQSTYDIVIPTVGRPTLAILLGELASAVGSRSDGPRHVFVVDDSSAETPVDAPPTLAGRLTVLRTAGHAGPATARNLGWRAGTAPLVVFMDDDVVPAEGWAEALGSDLMACAGGAGASQARIAVPTSERPTDWERSTARLEDARWITADLVVRRDALESVGGFDERFRRAYREDTDLALRMLDAGWSFHAGCRPTWHPVRKAPWWISVPAQRGNADDALLRRVHGRRWRARVDEPWGWFRWHVVSVGLIVLAGFGGGVASSTGRRGPLKLAVAAWFLLTARFAWARIAPGPRRPGEVVAMAVTTPLIPPAAVVHRVHGWWRSRSAEAWSPGA